MSRRAIFKTLAWMLIALICFSAYALAEGDPAVTEDRAAAAEPEPTKTREPEPTPKSTPAPTPTATETPDETPTSEAPICPSPSPTMEPAPTAEPAPSESSPEAPQTPQPTHTGTLNEPAITPELTAVPVDGSEEETNEPGDASGLRIAKAKPKLKFNLAGVVPAGDGGMPVPRIYQFSYKTVLCKYNGIPRSVSTSGCNVTCVSMVTAYLTGNYDQSPELMFMWALKNGLYYGNGLGQTEVSKVAKHFGVGGRWIGRDGDAVIEALEAGYPVIAHMGPGLFTSHGHYIVLRGVTEKGKILVNDPASAKRSRYAYPISTIVRESKGSAPFMICEAIAD